MVKCPKLCTLKYRVEVAGKFNIDDWLGDLEGHDARS